jgi:DNA-binding CsgD family transcriptional regulator
MKSEDGLARLTPGQLECLALVFQHLSSKEIAVELGISSHTVDQRIRQAIHHLGVERRSEAARIAAAAGMLEPYQRLIHQPPHIDPAANLGDPGGAVSHQIRHADRAGGTGSLEGMTEHSSVGFLSSLPMPIATRSRPRNEMSVGLRLMWIVLISLGSIFAIGMYLAGLESLARLLQE